MEKNKTMENKTMENKKKYVVTCWYDEKNEQIVAVKIGNTDPENLVRVSQIAHLHLPAMAAFRKENPKMFDKVTLPFSQFDVELRIVVKVRDL